MTLLISPFILFRKTFTIAALMLWYIQACFIKTNYLTGSIGTQTLLMVLILVAFVNIPNKKTDNLKDKNNIYTSPLMFLALWINFTIYYFYSGYTKFMSYSWQSGQTLMYLHTHLLMRQGIFSDIYSMIPMATKKNITYFVTIGELIAPLALLNIRLKEFLWYVIFIIQIGLLVFMNLTDIQLIMLIYSVMVFDPAWIRGKKHTEKIVVYYDGYCALCHGFVKQVINIDHENKIHFKAIQESEYFEAGKDIKSILVMNNGKLLNKTDAVIFIYNAVGGIFRIFAFVMNIFPRSISDKIYDIVSGNRYNIFGKKENVCPIIEEELKSKFI
jgi:predicted DCC family thiol-disulfide oxidoreductase YuxK